MWSCCWIIQFKDMISFPQVHLSLKISSSAWCEQEGIISDGFESLNNLLWTGSEICKPITVSLKKRTEAAYF